MKSEHQLSEHPYEHGTAGTQCVPREPRISRGERQVAHALADSAPGTLGQAPAGRVAFGQHGLVWENETPGRGSTADRVCVSASDLVRVQYVH